MTGARIITVPNFSAGFSIIWGLFAMWPWSSMFDRYPTLYRPMLGIVAYESFWGALFFCGGCLAMWLSYKRQQFKGALVLCVIYAFFASLYFIGDNGSPGWALYGYTSLVHFMYWGANRWKVTRIT